MPKPMRSSDEDVIAGILAWAEASRPDLYAMIRDVVNRPFEPVSAMVARAMLLVGHAAGRDAVQRRTNG